MGIFSKSKKPPSILEWFNTVQTQDVKAVEKFLKRGADVNQDLGGGVTALHFAVSANNQDMVNLLLIHGATVDETAVKFAKQYTGNNSEIVQTLSAFHDLQGLPGLLEQVMEESRKNIKDRKDISVISEEKAGEVLDTIEKNFRKRFPPKSKEENKPRTVTSEMDGALLAAAESGDCNKARALFDKAFWENRKIVPSWEHLKVALLREDKPMMRLLVTWGAKAPEHPEQLAGIPAADFARVRRGQRLYGGGSGSSKGSGA
jgi:hypothetical protein